MAIARRIGHGKKIIVGDKNIKNSKAICTILNEAGFDTESVECDISSRDSIQNIIEISQKYGEIKYFINAAGVSPSQAPIESLLKVDLYRTSV